MSDQEKTVFTKEMFTDKIDNELQSIQLYAPENLSAELLSYRLEVAGHLHNALYALPIPDELTETACGRENVLDQVYLFWTDEASKGKEIVDKLGLACECARLWLGDVRQEYRHGLLVERINAEHQAFMEVERQKTPDEIIEDAWKITCYNDLQLTLEHEELNAQVVDALLTMEYPLGSIYDEYLKRDMSDHMEELLFTAQEIASLQHQALTQDWYLPASPALQPYVEEYFAVYGSEPVDMQDEPEPEV